MQEFAAGKFHGVPFSEMLSTRRLRAAVDWRTTQSRLILKLCLPAASVLQIVRNKKFGTFSFYEQHSDKLSNLPARATHRA
jgi:hypothetical protein